MQLKKITRQIRYLLTRLFVIGVILTLGFLSFTSALAFCGLIGIAITAFIFAGLIEGEVYAQGINEALKKFFNFHHFRNVIVSRTLNELLNNKALVNDQNPFLSEYKQLKKSIHKKEEQLKKEQIQENLILDEEGRKYVEAYNKASAKELKRAKRDLKLMEKYFQKVISGNIPLTKISRISQETLDTLPSSSRIEIRNKTILSYIIFIISVIAGIGMGSVFLGVAPAGIVSLGALFGVTLIATALPPVLMSVLFVFAAFTAAGYLCLIYKALTGVLEKNLSQWRDNIKAYFQKNEKKGETSLEFAVRIGLTLLVGAIVLGIAGFATVTTGGTWLIAAQAGVLFILPATAATTLAVNIIIWIAGIATGIFTLAYSLETIQKLPKALTFLKKTWKEVGNKLEEYRAKENFWQFVNIPRFITVVVGGVFKFLVFTGHILFSGVIGEGSNLLPENLKGLTTGLNAFSDGLVDFTSHVDVGHDHSHGHGGHSHEHFGIPELFCKFLLSPIYLLSVVWDFLATPNDQPESYNNLGDLGAKWWNMLKRSFFKSIYGIEILDLKTFNDNTPAFFKSTQATFINAPLHEQPNSTEIPKINENYSHALSALKITKHLGHLQTGERTTFSQWAQKFENHEANVATNFFTQLKPEDMSDAGKKLYSGLEKIHSSRPL